MRAVLHWLWRQGPGNPVAVRVVQSGSRNPHHLWVRMGYLGALIALVILGLILGGGLVEQASLSELARAGSQIFFIVAYGQVVLVCLIAPLLMAGAIGREQAGRTLDVLLTTPLSSVQIVAGSLLGRLFMVVALLLSGLPLFAVLLLFGGVPMASIFIAFAVAALTALFVGAVAVTLSATRTGGRRTVFTFVAAVGAYLVGAYAVDVWLLRPAGGIGAGDGDAGGTTWLTPLHPLLVLEASLRPAAYRPPGPEQLAELPTWLALYLGRPAAAFAIWTLAGSALLLAAAAAALRHGGMLNAWWERLRAGPPERAEEGQAELEPAQRPAIGTRRPLEVWRNPVAWREAAARGRGIRPAVMRWGYAGLALTAAVAVVAAYHADVLPELRGEGGEVLRGAAVLHGLIIALVLMELAIAALTAIYTSAGAISREREAGTLELVLITPLTPVQFLWGKLRGLVGHLALLIAVPVATLAVVSGYALLGDWLGWERARFLATAVEPGGRQVAGQPLVALPEAPLLLAAMVVPFIGLCAAVGLSWSVRARGVLSAVVPTLLAVGVWAMVMALCGLRAAEQIPVLGVVINALSPATSVMMLVNPWDHVAGFLAHPTTGRVSLAVGALLAGGAYAVVVYALLLSMVSGFDQAVRQAET